MTVPYPVPVPAAAPDDAPLLTVQFNADWHPIVLRAVEDWYEVEKWDNPPTNLQAILDQLTTQLMSNIIVSPQIFPEEVSHFHKDSVVLGGNPVVAVVDSTAIWGHYARQNPAAINDTFKFDVFLRAGYYDFYFYHFRGANRGILSMWPDGFLSEIQFFDLYNSVNALAKISSNFRVHNDGMNTFICEVTSKNAASTGYFALLIETYFRRIGD